MIKDVTLLFECKDGDYEFTDQIFPSLPLIGHDIFLEFDDGEDDKLIELTGTISEVFWGKNEKDEWGAIVTVKVNDERKVNKS